MVRKVINQGKNSEVIQQQNRLLVLRLIRENKVTSRVQLAELTGLKQATITNIVNELISREYVKETGLIEGKNGRRVRGIMLNDERMRILVARITSEYYAAGIYDLNGTCVSVEKKFWNEDEPFAQKLKLIREDLLAYVEEYKDSKEIIGTGIVIEGSVARMASDLCNQIKADMETYLKAYFSEALDMAVYVDNMSNMSAYFEWNNLISKKERIHTLVCLSIGYAVDCAVIFNGILLKGRNGRVGHFGHVSIDMNGPVCECGNRGCIRNYISVDAVKKRSRELKLQYPDMELSEDCNIRDIVKAYWNGETFAVKLYEEVADKLGIVLTNLINQFNPEEVIFGDEIPNNDEFLELVKKYTKMRLPQHRYERVKIKVFQEERKTERDVGMRGMCLFVINEQLKWMELN